MEGRRKMAVNLRMIEDPDAVAHLPIRHFDGLKRFDELPRDRRCVADMWFYAACLFPGLRIANGRRRPTLPTIDVDAG